MSAKILKALLMIFVSLSLSGCSQKEYITKTVEVKVPIKCVTPDVVCDFNKETYTEVLIEMIKCIDRYKMSNEVCK